MTALDAIAPAAWVHCDTAASCIDQLRQHIEEIEGDLEVQRLARLRVESGSAGTLQPLPAESVEALARSLRNARTMLAWLEGGDFEGVLIDGTVFRRRGDDVEAFEVGP